MTPPQTENTSKAVDSTADQNATLSQFVNNGESISNNESPANIEEPTSKPESQEENQKSVDQFDLETISDPHLQDLVQEFTLEEIESIVETMMSEKNILGAVKEATDDDALQNNIDEITAFSTDSRSQTKLAADAVEDRLEMRPFDLTMTEPENEFQDPMISLDVDEEVFLTNNPQINADLLTHATRMKAETCQGQERLFNEWSDAVAENRIIEFKENRDPDALGFALPQHVPATGEQPNRTPITEIPYIGEATAKEIHPLGEIMSIEDLVSLSPKQDCLVSFPVDNRDYSLQRARGIAKGIVQHVTDDTTDVLGRSLNMMDQRDRESKMSWVDPSYVFGITPDDELLDIPNISSVTETSENSTKITVTTEANGEVKYSKEYWGMLKAVSDVTNANILAGEEEPAFVKLPDNGYLTLAPINSEQ